MCVTTVSYTHLDVYKRQIGYSLARPEISRYIRSCILTFNVNKMVIAAARASLKDKDFLQASWENNRDGKEYLMEELKGFGWRVWPSQSNFLYVTCLLYTSRCV